MIWWCGSVEVDAFHKCEQHVALVISKHIGGPWLLSNVYVSIEYRKRKVFWSEISRMTVLGLPSFIIGDFNCIVGSHEKMTSRQCEDNINS